MSLQAERPPNTISPLARIESRLRGLLPADLYAEAWVDPELYVAELDERLPRHNTVLKRVFEHLRTLQRILYDYVPRQVAEALPRPGEVRHLWQTGTLMFTDLAGFTPLMEANAARGKDGAESLLKILTTYFSEMIEITSKSGGSLLEFTGDAMLIQFAEDKRGDKRGGGDAGDVARAVRAGLRMQRAMSKFASLETEHGTFSLGMRVGIHCGRVFTADIGTPRRMEHVLLGTAVQRAKQAEGAGQRGRVNLTVEAYERVKDQYAFEEGSPGHMLVVDNLSTHQLGEFDIAPSGRRLASAILADTRVGAMIDEIERSISLAEPLACYIPAPILNLLVENAAHRGIPPDFSTPTVMFVNLIGLPESVDHAQPEEEGGIVSSFSRVFSLVNAAVEARGGVLKKLTYHLAGSDIMIFFGVPTAHTNDAMRAAEAALAIREIITGLEPPMVGGEKVSVTCQIGLARGPVFAAEIGETRGRREFNILSDTVNTAARLMGRAVGNRILLTEAVYQDIEEKFSIGKMGAMPLKGKSERIPIFELRGPLGKEAAPPEQSAADQAEDAEDKEQA